MVPGVTTRDRCCALFFTVLRMLVIKVGPFSFQGLDTIIRKYKVVEVLDGARRELEQRKYHGSFGSVLACSLYSFRRTRW